MEKNIFKTNMSTEEKREEKSGKETATNTWTDYEKQSSRSLYGCEILRENCTLAEANIKDAPNDAYIISYIVNDKLCYDLTRGTRVRLFNMYWDKFRENLKSIDFGNGRVNPKLWGYKSPEKKKRK